MSDGQIGAAEMLAALPRLSPRKLARLTPDERRAMLGDWETMSLPGQRPPKADWRTWVVLGGRGGGKTRAGAQWLDAMARGSSDRPAVGRMAIVGQSLHDVREVMVEGGSGLRALPRPRGSGPVWEANRRRLVWPNGAAAWAYSAEDPEALRGPQFGAAWADEWCAWRRPGETLALLRMGLRLGSDPRLVVTTTPRPIRALRTLLAEPGTVRSDLPTRRNAANLSPAFLEGMEALYGGTRMAAQELEGRLVDAEGGLWRFEDIERARVGAGEPGPGAFDRVVVGVDPPATAAGDACGIVVVGRVGGIAWVIEDRTVRGCSPQGWAGVVARAADRLGAARVVAETNQGGDMVEAVLKTAGVACPVRRVHARFGKRARAEPVAALYEQGRVRHLTAFPALEEELLGIGVDDGGASPDRADALVWAVTDLLIDGAGQGPRIRTL